MAFFNQRDLKLLYRGSPFSRPEEAGIYITRDICKVSEGVRVTWKNGVRRPILRLPGTTSREEEKGWNVKHAGFLAAPSTPSGNLLQVLDL